MAINTDKLKEVVDRIALLALETGDEELLEAAFAGAAAIQDIEMLNFIEAGGRFEFIPPEYHSRIFDVKIPQVLDNG